MSEPQQRTSLLPSVFSHSDVDLTKPLQSGTRAPPDAPTRKKPSITLSPAASPNQEAPLELDDDEPDASGVGSLPYEDVPEDLILPPSNFAPFYTIVEDASTGEHHHPTVHYIFSDDDPDILASTSLAAVENPSSRTILSSQSSASPQKASPSGSAAPQRTAPGEQYIIVDLDSDGQTVTGVQSLSADWQVTSSTIKPAPTWDEEAGSDALMLRIEGTGLARNTVSPGTLLEQTTKDTKGDVLAAMTSLTEKFHQGMELIDKVGVDQQPPGIDND